MTRKSKRELAQALDDLSTDVPEDPPICEWLAIVPQRYWGDEAETLRQFWHRIEAAAAEKEEEADDV